MASSLLSRYTDPETESEQKSQNEAKSLEIRHHCSCIKDKVNVLWELCSVDCPSPASSPDNPGSRRQTDRPRPRLVCALDASLSMRESYGPDERLSKIDRVKIFAQLLVKTMSSDDWLGVVTFGTDARVVLPLQKLTEEVKEKAVKAIDEISANGPTNISAGVCTAIDQFRAEFKRSRFYDDNVLLFTDGMPTVGVTEPEALVEVIRNKIASLREECYYTSDYTVRFMAASTGGFLPDVAHKVGQAFGSDAVYYLNESNLLELGLVQPLVLRQTCFLSHIEVGVRALNGVTLDKERMRSEYRQNVPRVRSEQVEDDATTLYYIYDVAADVPRVINCCLLIPPKRKRALKKKDVLRIQLKYRDMTQVVRTTERTVSYKELVRKEKHNVEMETLLSLRHEGASIAHRCLVESAHLLRKLDRQGAQKLLQRAVDDIRDLGEYFRETLHASEPAQEEMAVLFEAIITNLESCSQQVSNIAVNWDESWARMSAMATSFSRRSPPAAGVFVEDTKLFSSAAVNARLHEICYDLKEIYSAMGLATGALDDRQTRLEPPPPTPPEKLIKGDFDFADGMTLLVRRLDEAVVGGGGKRSERVDDSTPGKLGQCV